MAPPPQWARSTRPALEPSTPMPTLHEDTRSAYPVITGTSHQIPGTDISYTRTRLPTPQGKPRPIRPSAVPDIYNNGPLTPRSNMSASTRASTSVWTYSDAESTTSSQVVVTGNRPLSAVSDPEDVAGLDDFNNMAQQFMQENTVAIHQTTFWDPCCSV